MMLHWRTFGSIGELGAFRGIKNESECEDLYA